MTTTAPARTVHPAAPGYTAAFINRADGQPYTYMQYAPGVNPADLFHGGDNTVPPPPLSLPAADAQLAADGYLRVGDWSFTDDIWGCAARRVTIPAGTIVRDRYDRTHTARQAIEVIASGAGALTVAGRDEDGKHAPHLKATVVPVNTVFGYGARVGFPPGGTAHSPAVARTQIAVSQLATDIAEAATLVAAARKRDGNGILTDAGIKAAR